MSAIGGHVDVTVRSHLTTYTYDDEPSYVLVEVRPRLDELEDPGAKPSTETIILLQLGGSSDPQGRFQMRQQAVRTFIENLPDTDRVAIILFASTSELWLRLTGAAKLREQGTDHLTSSINQLASKTSMRPLLAPALVRAREHLSREARRAAVRRVYCLTEGAPDDVETCARVLNQLGAAIEVHIYGFGEMLADSLSMKILAGCPWGVATLLQNPGQVESTFRQLAMGTTERARQMRLEVVFASNVIPGSIFQYDPTEESLDKMSGTRTRLVDLNALETERLYSFLFEVRLPPVSTDGRTQVGSLSLLYRAGLQGQTYSQVINLQVERRKEIGTPDVEVCMKRDVLLGMRDKQPQAQIAMYEAQLVLYRRERRDPHLIVAIQQKLESLRNPAMSSAPAERARLYLESRPTSSRPPAARPSSSSPLPSKGTLPLSVQKALVTLDKLKTKLDALDRQKAEPIAIIGLACRFPGGASSPEAFFRILESGADTITPVPATRWTGDTWEGPRTGTRWGAFLQEDVSHFDAAFFRISPREAERLDPQQRLLLELTWEAMERAGLVQTSLTGSRTGVFIGLTATDYMLLSLQSPLETWDRYTAMGSAHSFPASRIAHAFGFQGPTMVIDTACSSSLVAVHVACQSLRSGETDMAVTGGMNLMLSPSMFEMTARINALSPDGRCKTFDARADGYVRGEGGGVLILKRLSDAQRDGDPIAALIRGSAVNQDGDCTGLTTSNVLSQQAVLQQALANARVAPEDVSFVEAHGAGTSLGDPIELEALKAVLGGRREDGLPCVLGAVKTNIGHLEAAAGAAGLIKTIMAFQKELIPRNLHFCALDPRISLDDTPFVVPTENTPWNRTEKPRIAGVSSFGLSGTNAHVLLEEAPVEPLEQGGDHDRWPVLLPLSAKTPEALIEVARALAETLAQPDGDPPLDIVHTASVRRMHHDHRLAVVARDRKEMTAALTGFVRDGAAPGVVSGKAGPVGSHKLVFVFPGHGSPWVGMGRQLLAEESAFRVSMELCHEAIRRHGTFSLLDEIQADETTSRLAEIDVVQPMIFAIQVSLASLWQSWGVEPDAVIGHGMGEVAAARVAGVLSLDDATKVICRGSRMLVRIAGQGAMAHVELSADEAQLAIAGYESVLGVAARNGPHSSVLSGDPAAISAVLATLQERGVFCRRMNVDVASQSPQVDMLKEDLFAILFNLRPRTNRIPMFSTVTGQVIRGPEMTADYWVRNLREPVLFSQVVQRQLDDRQTLFVEVSPHPVLTAAIEENMHEKSHEGAAIGSLQCAAGERRCMLEALGALHVRGVTVDWKKHSRDPTKGRCVALPTYPFQRRRYWL